MSKIQRGFQFLTDKDYRFDKSARLGFFNNMPDKKFLERKFLANLGYPLNLQNPQTFNEKLQWLKLYNRQPEYTMMVDKYKVRKYIAETIGEEYLIPLLGVWEDPEEIDFDALPNQFVLKCNHNSGLGMCICKDKSKLNIQKVKRELKKGLKGNYYLHSREWPYKDVPRCIIAEKYMKDKISNDLKDYKFLCFNGTPKLIQIHQNRFTGRCHTEDFYTTDWQPSSISKTEDPVSNKPIKKPINLESMLEFSRKLSANIPHIRIDWYEINGKIYFGEITFFDDSGFVPFSNFEDDKLLGSWITLPEPTI